MRITWIIILLLLITAETYSQGFDWQYSARLPFETPRFFIGISGIADFTYSDADLPLMEKEYRLCCSFQTGKGYSGSLGLNFEYWQRDYSIFTKVMYGYYTSDFSIIGESYPIREGGSLTSEYTASTAIHRIILEPGIRFRLFNSFFSLDGSLRASVKIKDSYTITDSKAIVNDTYNPRIPDLYSINLQFILGFGYDFSIGLGKYSTISLYFGLPLTNMSSEGKWLPWSIGAGFTYNNGL